MPISVQCPGCGKSLKGKDELAGKRVKCPKCGHEFGFALSAVQSATTQNAPPTVSPTTVVGAFTVQQAPSANPQRGFRRYAWYASGTILAAILLVGLVTVFGTSARNTTPDHGELPARSVPETNRREDRFKQLLSDIRAHDADEPRGLKGALLPLGELLPVMEASVKDGIDGCSSETYSTWLNERKLLEVYGQPDETADDSIQYWSGFSQVTKKSKSLRYAWLHILVTTKGEIWAVKFATKDRNDYIAAHK